MNYASERPSSLRLVSDDILERSRTILCFSHLRWDFVFQRPQHLMSRFAASDRVIFWEEPRFIDGEFPRLDIRECESTGVIVVTPELLAVSDRASDTAALKSLLDVWLAGEQGRLVRWYYTPMMLPFSEHVSADCVVYDCMDRSEEHTSELQSLIRISYAVFSLNKKKP